VPVVVVAPPDALFEKTFSNIEEVCARGGKVVMISDAAGIARMGGRCAFGIAVPHCVALCRALALHDPVQLSPITPAVLNRHRCRPAPQPRQKRDGGVGATGSPRTQVTSAALRYHPASFETRQLFLRSRRKRRFEGAHPQDEETWWIAFKEGPILRSPRSGRLEGRNNRSSLLSRIR